MIQLFVKAKAKGNAFMVFLRFGFVALLAICGILFGDAAWGEGINLTVFPASVTISPWYHQVEVRVILKNTSSTNLLGPSLEFFGNDGFEVEIGPASATNAEAGASIVWLVRVTNLVSARIPGAVLFEADFSSANDGLRQQVFSTLDVTLAADSSQPNPIEATLVGSFDSIEQNRPGEAYLVVSNNLDVPVHIVNLEAHEPTSVTFSNGLVPFAVAPHRIQVRPVRLEAERKVTPGTYPLLLNLTVEWDKSGHTESRSVVVSKQVTVGVFFESELLKALGVPSFLLLPGCLFLFTMQLLVTLGVMGAKNLSRVPQLSATSPGFWIVAVTFSGLFAFGYAWFTGTNYLIRYGVDDLRNVWLLSIFIGSAVFFLIAIGTIRWRKANVPTSQDDPITILRKMHRHCIGIVAAPVTFQINKVELNAFSVEGIADEQTLLWVAPKIMASWGDSPEARQAQENFEHLIDNRASAAKIADALTDAVKKGHVAVNWQSHGSVPNPYHLKIENIAGYGTPDLMVQSQ